MYRESLLLPRDGDECLDKAIAIDGSKFLQRLLIVRELDGAF